MLNHAHRTLAKEILALDTVPEDGLGFSKWILAERHLKTFAGNAHEDETILYASGPFTYLSSVVVPRGRVEPPNVSDLLEWNDCNPHTTRSAYVYGGGSDHMWVENGLRGTGAKSLEGAHHLIYGRYFDGLIGNKRKYFEAHQELTHLAGLHWVDEESAYCRLDDNGDLDAVLSISSREHDDSVTLASIHRSTLDEYLSAGNLALIRVFDLTLLRRHEFTDWGISEEAVFGDGEGMWYRQRVKPDEAAYTRGFQLIQPFDSYAPRKPTWRFLADRSDKRYADFIIFDFRNKGVKAISAHPSCTTNYFEANNNDLPFETSPAFFRSDVILKYKADKDKYKIETRSIHCRSSWSINYDINEAGQIHAYICDLRDLPYEEQLHWASFNENPKASISKRAYETDFKAEFTSVIDPIDKLRTLLERWHQAGFDWWGLPDRDAMSRVCTPVTQSREEWAEAFLDLNKLVNEGFSVRAIRTKLNEHGVSFKSEEKSLKLLERLWGHRDPLEADVLHSLKEVAHIRSKAKGHAAASESETLARKARKEHGSYRAHFDHVCLGVIEELNVIEGLLTSE